MRDIKKRNDLIIVAVTASSMEDCFAKAISNANGNTRLVTSNGA
jgi:hypothetical protein